jgi:hypothetical protein
MTKPTIKIQDIATGEITEREMNDQEFAQYEIDLATAEAETTAEATKLAEKAALLKRLGITADEAALLLS